MLNSRDVLLRRKWGRDFAYSKNHEIVRKTCRRRGRGRDDCEGSDTLSELQRGEKKTVHRQGSLFLLEN